MHILNASPRDHKDIHVGVMRLLAALRPECLVIIDCREVGLDASLSDTKGGVSQPALVVTASCPMRRSGRAESTVAARPEAQYERSSSQRGAAHRVARRNECLLFDDGADDLSGRRSAPPYRAPRPTRAFTTGHADGHETNSQSSSLTHSVRNLLQPIEQRHESEQGLLGVCKADELGSD